MVWTERAHTKVIWMQLCARRTLIITLRAASTVSHQWAWKRSTFFCPSLSNIRYNSYHYCLLSKKIVVVPTWVATVTTYLRPHDMENNNNEFFLFLFLHTLLFPALKIYMAQFGTRHPYSILQMAKRRCPINVSLEIHRNKKTFHLKYSNDLAISELRAGKQSLPHLLNQSNQIMNWKLLKRPSVLCSFNLIFWILLDF